MAKNAMKNRKYNSSQGGTKMYTLRIPEKYKTAVDEFVAFLANLENQAVLDWFDMAENDADRLSPAFWQGVRDGNAGAAAVNPHDDEAMASAYRHGYGIATDQSAVLDAMNDWTPPQA
ncbi:MAG: hypothetical protein GY862_06020 [Gammaproteobacteria bacterium]|nr:hypothetical protein [Gammaproteobacteria bacterium]